MTKTSVCCEACDVREFEIPDGDKTAGQLCPACQAKGTLIRMTTGPDDGDPRYFAGVEMTAAYLDEPMVYGDYQEFNDAEYKVIGKDWNTMPDLDRTSFQALQASVNARMAWLTSFWKRNHCILEAREAYRPNSGWLPVPEFVIVLEEVR